MRLYCRAGQGELPKGQEKVLWGMTSSRRCKTEQFVKKWRAEVSPPNGLHGYKFEMIAKL